MNQIKPPEFCFIAPIDYLQYTTVSSSHLLLAHLVEKSDKYTNFYHNLSKQGDQYIMLDNSAYERKIPYDATQLISLGQACGANAIVLPDYPFQDSNITIDAATKYIPSFKSAGFDTFFVPQGISGDLEGWIDSYIWASNNDDIDIIGISILGVPVALSKISPAFARVVMISILIERGIFNFNKKHHFLGLNSGVALEIPSLLKLGVLTTIDSSGPIHAALNMHEYTKDADSYQRVSKLKNPVDFFLPLTKDKPTLKRIEHNIQMTLDLFNDNITNTEIWYANE